VMAFYGCLYQRNGWYAIYEEVAEPGSFVTCKYSVWETGRADHEGLAQ
jgi:hypothetical protein